MGRRSGRRFVALVAAAIIAALAATPIVGAQEGTDSSAGPDRFVLNDSPTYSFLTGGAPTRDTPSAVAQLDMTTIKGGLRIDVTQLARFVPESQVVTARVTFYPRKASVAISGGFQFPLGGATGDPVDATTVERTGEGTPTSPEAWEPSEDLAVVKAGYQFPKTTLTLNAKGKYGRMLRDPFTAVGIDLLPSDTTGAAAVQPSARVSIGDLTGAIPGLLAGQGTRLGPDFSPMPWITAPASDVAKRRFDEDEDDAIQSFSYGADMKADFRLGKLASNTGQIRLFITTSFLPVRPGEMFVPYTLVLFAPLDTTSQWLRGDAFASHPVADVQIKEPKRGKFTVTFPDKMSADVFAFQFALGDKAPVLLATSFQAKF